MILRLRSAPSFVVFSLNLMLALPDILDMSVAVCRYNAEALRCAIFFCLFQTAFFNELLPLLPVATANVTAVILSRMVLRAPALATLDGPVRGMLTTMMLLFFCMCSWLFFLFYSPFNDHPPVLVDAYY